LKVERFANFINKIRSFTITPALLVPHTACYRLLVEVETCITIHFETKSKNQEVLKTGAFVDEPALVTGLVMAVSATEGGWPNPRPTLAPKPNAGFTRVARRS
jgi:hypothetical protein